MQQLASGLTRDQLERLRVKALKAVRKSESSDERQTWQVIADAAAYLNDLYGEDKTLSANDRLTATEVREMLGKRNITSPATSDSRKKIDKKVKKEGFKE